MKKIYFWVSILLFSVPIDSYSSESEHKEMVVIIPSYNNAKWARSNLNSVLDQDYPNFRVIYIDDNSTDKTYKIAKKVKNPKKISLQIIKNKKRVGALENIYRAVHSCKDHEIVVLVDGDDWLYDSLVLKKINEQYVSSKDEVWLTYGSYVNYPNMINDIPRQFDNEVIEKNLFRENFHPSHTRTFYAWLFKRIREDDLKYEDKFYDMTWDLAMMFPMIEMCGERFKYIQEPTYIYNQSNPINDHKKNLNRQNMLAKHIRSLPRYARLVNNPIEKKSVKN